MIYFAMEELRVGSAEAIRIKEMALSQSKILSHHAYGPLIDRLKSAELANKATKEV